MSHCRTRRGRGLAHHELRPQIRVERRHGLAFEEGDHGGDRDAGQSLERLADGGEPRGREGRQWYIQILLPSLPIYLPVSFAIISSEFVSIIISYASLKKET